jgi:hypothetical protein
MLLDIVTLAKSAFASSYMSYVETPVTPTASSGCT